MCKGRDCLARAGETSPHVSYCYKTTYGCYGRIFRPVASFFYLAPLSFLKSPSIFFLEGNPHFSNLVAKAPSVAQRFEWKRSSGRVLNIFVVQDNPVLFFNRCRNCRGTNVTTSITNSQGRKIQIRKPTIADSYDEGLWKEVRKYSKLIPFEPEPNMGRVQEIKDEIRKGTYLTSEIIESTAARLASRFMKSE